MIPEQCKPNNWKETALSHEREASFFLTKAAVEGKDVHHTSRLAAN